ncbi:unnamed protein product [Caenorhabditis bovis]|uniref:Potassium channel domain-containing protein n=1 Tax=Caenorhabditis bovis TaxID=2654633 RepID=A0A8S1F4A9_9PELO|nr:unnamed protein product [Caenorhabditis bovis]
MTEIVEEQRSLIIAKERIGYGDIYPTSFNGKLVCMCYCVIGIPLLLTTISTNSTYIVEFYNVAHKTINSKASNVKDLPWFVSLFLLVSHCLLGGVIFSCWIDSMTFISAVYFSFISIATIGFGDFVPTPETWFQHFVIISFLSTGIAILTTFFGTLQRIVLWIHNVGRQLRGTENAEIWFNGHMMTVGELVALVADHFQCTPEKLRDVLHDLDRILEVACNPTEDDSTRSLRVTVAEDPEQHQVTVKSVGSHQRTLTKENEMAIQALGAIQHHIRKPSTRAKPKASHHHFGEIFHPNASDTALVGHFKESPLAMRKDGIRVHSEGNLIP